MRSLRQDCARMRRWHEPAQCTHAIRRLRIAYQINWNSDVWRYGINTRSGVLKKTKGQYSHMGRAKRKVVFEHAQNVRIHIILCMHKVSSGPLLSIDTFYSIQWFRWQQRPWSDCANAQADLAPSLSAYARRHVFAWWGTYKVLRQQLLIWIE